MLASNQDPHALILQLGLSDPGGTGLESGGWKWRRRQSCSQEGKSPPHPISRGHQRKIFFPIIINTTVDLQ